MDQMKTGTLLLRYVAKSLCEFQIPGEVQRWMTLKLHVPHALSRYGNCLSAWKDIHNKDMYRRKGFNKLRCKIEFQEGLA